MLLAQRDWKYKYTPEDGDLVRLFYLPALEHAVRYDRLTGYFNANALALAARGIEGLIRNHGHRRLIVGCTLAPAEIAAIERGEQLRALVEQRLTAQPLTPPDAAGRDALELLAWMVAHGILEVKVAVPCDAQRRPLPADGIFHEKAGIIEDRSGDRIAWNGSLNETAAGWQYNWESINVFTSWGQEPQRVSDEETINLHYEGTVETDVYRALRNRIGLFQTVIGRLQPILSQLPSRIAVAVLADSAEPGVSVGRAQDVPDILG